MKIVRTDMPEGNPYAIMGLCHNFLKQVWGDDAPQKIKEFDAAVEDIEEGVTGYEHLQNVAKTFLPTLIDFARSDEVEVTETIVRRDPDAECSWCGERLNGLYEEDCPCQQ